MSEPGPPPRASAPRVLLTAFAPYGDWRENASARALEALGADPPAGVDLATRIYPVDYAALAERLPADLAAGFDVALHLGQAPGRARVELETVALNLRRDSEAGEGEARPLLPGGSEALRATVPVWDWAGALRAAGIPAAVSFHAGTFLCNAALYTSLHTCAARGLPTRCGFAHLPLAPEQAAGRDDALPSLPSEWAARALRLLLGRLTARPHCDT